MKILGIDQSLTSTGAAWLSVNERGEQHRQTAIIAPPKGMTGGERLAFFRKWLAGELRYGLDAVAFEDSIIGPGNGKVLGELLGVIKCTLTEYKADHPAFIIVTPHNSHVKQFAVGAGKADKSLLVEKANKLWPGVLPQWVTKTQREAVEDQCDALWIAEIAAHIVGNWPGTNDVQRKLIAQYRASISS